MADRGAPSLGATGTFARLRAQPSVPVSIGVTVLLAAFLLGAGPRLLVRVSTEDLRATVSDPHPAQRNIRVERQAAINPGDHDDPLAIARSSGDIFADTEFPDSVTTVISSSYTTVDFPRFTIEALPGEEPPHPFGMFLTLRYQDHLDDHSELVEGALPTIRDRVTMLVGEDCPEDAGERVMLMDGISTGEIDFEEGVDCGVEDVPVIEVALTRDTLDALGLQVGSEMLLTPDPNDPLYFGVPSQALDVTIVMSISGVIELSDPDLDYWYADPSLHMASIEETADFRLIYATGVPAREVVGNLISIIDPAPQAYTWRHFVDPELVTGVDIGILRNDLRLLELAHSPATALLGDYRFATSLGLLLAEHEAQRSETVAMLSLAMAGLFAVVLATIVLLAALMTARQRPSIVLNRNRGASQGQLILTRTYEALLLVIPPAVIGYVAARFAIPGAETDLLSYRSVVAIASAAVLSIVLAALRLITQRLGSLQSDAAAHADRRGRRIVFEALVLIAAVGSILVLRRRGLADTAPESAQFDALLAVTPALIGSAVAVLLIRVFPLVVRVGSGLAGVFRGVVVFVSLRRVQARTATENLPMAVVLVCLTVATLASMTANSITAGQDVASWQTVGADFIVEGFREGVNMPPGVDPEALPVDALAMGKSFDSTRVDWEMGATRVDVLAIESGAFDMLSAGSPLEANMPPEMVATLPENEPLPVMVSEDWPGSERPGPGDTLSVGLGIGGLRPDVVVVETRSSFPGIPAGRPFMIVDLDHLKMVSDLPLTPTVARLRAPAAASEDVVQAVGDQSGTARVSSRYGLITEIEEDPFIAWASSSLEITFWVAISFGVLTAVSALAMTSAARRRDLTYLRTLGLDNGQAAAATFIEQLPAVILGTVAGVAAGIGATLVLEPAIVLTGFTGGAIPVGLDIDWSAVTTMLTTLILAQAVAVGIFVLVNRRQELSRILRVGDDR